MFLKCLWFIFFISCFSSVIQADNAVVMSRINAHLLINDPVSAAIEARIALEKDTGNRQLHQAYIKSLAKAHDEKHLSRAFGEYKKLFEINPDEDRDLCEAMAWGIIDSAINSDSPIVRIFSSIAAFHGEDAKSVNHLRRASYDSNSAVRAVVVHLISSMRDAPLCAEILRLFNSETIWEVRIEVIKAIGKMKIREGRQGLLTMIADSHCNAEEKAAAIQSLVYLLEDIDRPEIINLASSDRAGLRLLACEVIAHLQNTRDADLLWQLSANNCSEVRAAALRTIGLLGISECGGRSVVSLAKERCRDFNKDVAITAAWLLSIHDSASVKSVFSFWINHEVSEIRHFAAAALSATGAYGVPFMHESFYATQDPCVKINLALGLIRQGIDLPQSCEAIFQEFSLGNKRWRSDETGSFEVIVPLKNSHVDDQLMSSEEVNQLTRLEMLNLLAVLKYSKIQEAIQLFLQQKIWGVSGTAAAVLLTECDSEAISIIEDYLNVSSPGIKIQSALILALWGRGEAAVNILEQNYSRSDRQTKEKILEGIGRVGLTSSLPFLLERLQDPQQTLRLIAASAILQCLYH